MRQEGRDVTLQQNLDSTLGLRNRSFHVSLIYFHVCTYGRWLEIAYNVLTFVTPQTELGL